MAIGDPDYGMLTINPSMLAAGQAMQGRPQPMLMPQPLPQEAIMRRAGQSMQGRPNPVFANPAPEPPATPLAPPPALSNTNAPTTAGALSPQQGRRANTMLSVERPDLGIGTNEMLMCRWSRVSKCRTRWSCTQGAMFDQYGNIQDQRRRNVLKQV